MVDEHIEQGGEFGRIVNPLAQPNDRSLDCVFRNGMESRSSVGLRGGVQLNIPSVINGSKDSFADRLAFWSARRLGRIGLPNAFFGRK